MDKIDNIYNQAVCAVYDWLVSKGYHEDDIMKECHKEDSEEAAKVIYDIVVYNSLSQVKEYYEIKISPLRSGTIHKFNEKNKRFIQQMQKLSQFAENALGYLVLYNPEEKDFTLYLLSDTISSLSQFVRLISYSHRDYEGHKYFFRGQKDISYGLKPSLYRNTGRQIDETQIFKEALRRCPEEFEGLTSTFQKLVKLQHYGCPTRLLDLTTNALVALYFAVEDNTCDSDGVVYSFNVSKEDIKSYDSDSVSVVANLARRADFRINLQATDFNKTSEAAYLLHEIRYEKPHFRPLIDVEDLHKTFCVLPKLDNPRIRQQNGAFFLFGIEGPTKKSCSKLGMRPVGIIIEKEYKDSIRNELSLFGITESYMYPEVDHVLKDIISLK